MMFSTNPRNTSASSIYLVVEEFLNINRWQSWFNDNWNKPLYISFVYVVIILLLKSYMRGRKPFELRKLLLLWNGCLAVFSITAILYILVLMLSLNFDKDFWHKTICTREVTTPIADILELLFVWSKVVELGDTVFIVLRKKRLIFLHWYHHITVLCSVWFIASSGASLNHSLSRINYFVHSIMYSYYTLKTLQIRISRFVSMAITSLQLAQMVAGIGICLFIVFENHHGARPCQTKLEYSYLFLVLYATYFLLFVIFFKNTYFSKKSVKTH